MGSVLGLALLLGDGCSGGSKSGLSGAGNVLATSCGVLKWDNWMAQSCMMSLAIWGVKFGITLGVWPSSADSIVVSLTDGCGRCGK